MSFEDLAISVEAVSKRYEIYNHPRDQLKQILYPRIQRALGRETRQYFREFWALKGVSMQIARGESYGIVGLNGSGKSTLLQIIAGTLSPTSGSVRRHGRVAALLELGSGFNPDFSGRENVFMHGTLLGFSRDQIESRLDAIQGFADIGEHFDQALVTYSSGMQMRVAFAVATAFDPDILIIDEALAVGDAYFQQKCFHKIERFKESGGTLLFVSHEANVVKHLCDKAILISHGLVVSDGVPRAVIDLYQGLVAKKTDLSEQTVQVSQAHHMLPEAANPVSTGAMRTWKKATTITTNNDADLLDFALLDEAGQPVNHIESETHLTVRFKVRLNKFFERPAFGLIVRDRTGRSLFETSTYAMRVLEVPIAEGKEVMIRFDFHFNLRAGQYSFSVGVANKGFSRSEFEEYSLLMHDVEQIQVTEAEGAAYYGGIFNMKPSVDFEILEPACGLN